jgi:hypothetical protein
MILPFDFEDSKGIKMAMRMTKVYGCPSVIIMTHPDSHCLLKT